jgi:hypothetical protein
MSKIPIKLNHLIVCDMLRLYFNVKLYLFLNQAIELNQVLYYKTILNPHPIDSENTMKSKPRPFDFE